MTDKKDIALSDRKSKFGLFRSKTHVKIFAVILITAVVINTIGLIIGAVFLTRSIRATMESDMQAAVDISDQFVTKEIELLKGKALDAAREIAQALPVQGPDVFS